jgi:hypothetical protein
MVGGRQCMKITLLNPLSTIDDIPTFLDKIRTIWPETSYCWHDFRRSLFAVFLCIHLPFRNRGRGSTDVTELFLNFSPNLLKLNLNFIWLTNSGEKTPKIMMWKIIKYPLKLNTLHFRKFVHTNVSIEHNIIIRVSFYLPGKKSMISLWGMTIIMLHFLLLFSSFLDYRHFQDIY